MPEAKKDPGYAPGQTPGYARRQPKGYTIEAYCHECCMVVVKVGPYVFIDELVNDVSKMLDRHNDQVHSRDREASGA